MLHSDLFAHVSWAFACLLVTIPVASPSVPAYAMYAVITFDFNGWANTGKTMFELENNDIKKPESTHEFTWIYGDGTRDERITMTTFAHEHNYTTRGVYEGSVTVMDWTIPAVKIVTFKATIGGLQLSPSSPLVVAPSEKTNILISCDSCVGSRNLLKGDDSEERDIGTNTKYEISYSSKGDYTMTFTYQAEAVNGSNVFYSLTMEAIVRPETSPTKASLEVSNFPYSSYLPSEDVTFQLSHQYASGDISCAFDFEVAGYNAVHGLPNGVSVVTSSNAYTAPGTYDVTSYCWKGNSKFSKSNAVSITVDEPLSRLVVVTDEPVLYINQSNSVILRFKMDAPYGIPALIVTKVDWGDGEVDNDLGLVEVLAGFTNLTNINHAYTQPGSYSIEVTVREDFMATKVILPVFVQYLTEKIEVSASIQNEDLVTETSFDLVLSNLPYYDFGYVVEMGDSVQQPVVYNPSSSTDLCEFEDPLTLKTAYVYAGNYNLTVTIYNFYSNYTIGIPVSVAQGIPKQGWELVTVTSESIIVDESEVEFKILYSGDISLFPNVTVVCSLLIDKVTVATPPNNLSVDYPHTTELPWKVTFDDVDVTLVSLKCVLGADNSEHTLDLNVTAVNYTDSDYILNYDEMMVISGTPTTANDVHSIFTLALLDLSKPLRHDTTWDFGDGSPVSQLMLFLWDIRHLYNDRGVYSGSVIIDTPKGVFTRSFTIYIGMSQMAASPSAGLPETNVTVNCWEIRGMSADFKAWFGDGTRVQTSGLQFSHVNQYMKAGKYDVKTQVTVGVLTEIITYKEAVFIDEVPNSLEIQLDNEYIEMPPGIVNMDVSMTSGGVEVKYMECDIDFDDLLDQRHDYFEGGMAVGNSFSRKRMYIGLGGHAIRINCSNPVGYLIVTKYCWVKSDCFSDDGIFEEKYANPNSPMYVITSIKVLVTSRVDILCEVSSIQFQWDLWRLDPNTFEEVEQISIKQPKKDTFKIKQGMLDPNMYKLSLNVSMINRGNEQWLYGLTYVKVVGAPIIAEINGGLLRATGNNTAKINARSKSHDPDLGLSKKSSLIFEWECQDYQTSYDLGILEQLVNANVPGTDVDCTSISQEVKPGTIQFHDIPEVPRGYAFIVKVSTAVKEAVSAVSYVQYTKGAPEIGIQCIVNCESKVAVTNDLTMEAECPYCFAEDFDMATITWTLFKKTSSTSSVQVNDLYTFTEILDDNHAAIVIQKNNLEACEKYVLNVVVDIPTRQWPGQSYYNFEMNCPPKDGVCSTQPTSGEARSINFKTTCTGWVDEGYDDGLAGEVPLIYKFYISQGDFAIPIFQGAQAMSPNKTLPVIPGSKGGQYNITVRIFDVLSDYTEVNNTITLEVTPLTSTSEVGEGASQAAFSSGLSVSVLNKQLFETSYSSSIYQTIEVGTLNSFITDFSNRRRKKRQAVDSTTTQAPGLSFEDVWDGYVKTEDGSLKKEIGQQNKKFTSQLLDNIGEIESLDGAGLVAVGEALSIIMYSEDTTDFDTTDMAGRLVDSTAETLEALTSQDPYPFGEKVDEAVYGLAGAMDRLLTKNSPSYTTNATHTDIEAVGLTGIEAYFFHHRILEKKAAEDEAKIEKNRNKMDTFENSADKILKSMYKSLVKGQHAKNIGRDGITFTASKNTARSLENKTMESEDYSFSFPDSLNETVNGTDEILLKASVTKKNPYSWSSDHSSYDISTPVLNVALETTNGTSLFAGNITLKLSRPMPEFNVYQVSETKAGEDQFCHHQFQLKKSSETAYVFLDVGGRIGEVKAYFRNGQPATTWSEDVISKTGEYVDFNSNARRKKRSAGNARSYMLRFLLQPGEMSVGLIYVALDFKSLSINISSYSFLAYSDSCRVWDRENNVWSNTYCKVSPYSSPYETLCDCKDAPGYNFASSFYVPPNLINFNMVFSKFDVENAVVYGTVLGLFFVFGLAMIWARRMGRQDHNRWKIGYLKDNFVGDSYFYLLTVHNGLGGSSGTESRVRFILTGGKGDSGVRVLSDGQRHLETGTVMSFIMATGRSLGDLTYLRIWHDNSGQGSKQSWYLNKIYVEDIQTDTRSSFCCNQWLAIDKEDGLIDRIIPVSFSDDIMTFSKLFAEHSRINISDSHLWISIFIRPERSMFTRLQRVACCLLTLLLAMISSALFYQPEDVDGNSSNAPGTEVRLGTLRFSMTTVFTSFVGIFITLPPILLIVCLFKSRRPWKSRGICCCRNRRREDQEKEEQERTLSYYLKRAGQMNGVVTTDEDPLISKFENNPLPPWCAIIAWSLLIFGILSCAFAIILYSMQWGKTVSEQWLSSFVLSFFESIFIMDPIKVLFLSAIFALCMRRPGDESNSNVPIEEIGEQSQLYGCKEMDPTILPPDPVPEDVLQKARKRKEEENVANGVFAELMLYIFFVFCLFCVSYGSRDERSFILTDHLQNTLTKMPFRKANMYYGSETEAFTWSRIRVTKDVYTWLNLTMAGNMLPFADMMGNPLTWEERLFMADLANYRIGPVRVRQVRMPRKIPEPIKENPTFVGPHITNQEELTGTLPRSMGYDITLEDTADYCVGWTAPPCIDDVSITSEAWKFRSSAEEETFPIMGKFTLYSGAAYAVDLIFNKHIVIDMYLRELESNNWLDLHTRAVFVEFYLYNVNLNLFTSARLTAEFPEYGGAFMSVDIKPKRLYDLVGPLGSFVLICQIVMVITTMVFGIKTIVKMVKLRRSFFYSGWNLLDLTILMLCLCAMVSYILRRIFYSKAIARFKSDPKVFVNFYRTIVFDDVYGWFLGALVFFCTLRLMRILGYNQRITMIAAVLKIASRDLFSFAFVFVAAMTSFAFTGYTLFHANLASFKSMWKSYETLIYLLLGKNVFKQMVVVSAIVSRVYFFFLAVAIVMFFMTIFQSILNASASQVRLDVKNTPSPYGVMDVVNKIYRSVVLDNRIVEYIKRRHEMNNKCKANPIAAYTNQPEDPTQTQKVLSVLRDHFYKSLGQSRSQSQQNVMNEDEDDLTNDRDENRFKRSYDNRGMDEDQTELGGYASQFNAGNNPHFVRSDSRLDASDSFGNRLDERSNKDSGDKRNGSQFNKRSWSNKDTSYTGHGLQFNKGPGSDNSRFGDGNQTFPFSSKSTNHSRHPRAPPTPNSQHAPNSRFYAEQQESPVQSKWDSEPNAQSSAAALDSYRKQFRNSPFWESSHEANASRNPMSTGSRDQKYSPKFILGGDETDTWDTIPSVFRRANADDD